MAFGDSDFGGFSPRRQQNQTQNEKNKSVASNKKEEKASDANDKLRKDGESGKRFENDDKISSLDLRKSQESQSLDGKVQGAKTPSDGDVSFDGTLAMSAKDEQLAGAKGSGAFLAELDDKRSGVKHFKEANRAGGSLGNSPDDRDVDKHFSDEGLSENRLLGTDREFNPRDKRRDTDAFEEGEKRRRRKDEDKRDVNPNAKFAMKVVGAAKVGPKSILLFVKDKGK